MLLFHASSRSLPSLRSVWTKEWRTHHRYHHHQPVLLPYSYTYLQLLGHCHNVLRCQPLKGLNQRLNRRHLPARVIVGRPPWRLGNDGLGLGEIRNRPFEVLSTSGLTYHTHVVVIIAVHRHTRTLEHMPFGGRP